MPAKTCLVTGANSGVGKATARGLAERGHRVLMLCRSEERGQAALEGIRQDTGNDALDLVLCDLASQEQIRQTAKRIRGEVAALDVLVNNAGLVLDERHVTEDGNEKQFAVNHLAPFLLTHELLDLFAATGEQPSREAARIVNVASEAHRNVRSVPEAFQNLEGSYRGFQVYSQTKLYNIHFTQALARRLDRERVTVNCLHPGVVGSNFGRQGPWYVRWFMKLARPFLTSPADAAQTPLHLAISPDLSRVTGRYFKDEQTATPSRKARDERLQEELWRKSEELTGATAWPEASRRS